MDRQESAKSLSKQSLAREGEDPPAGGGDPGGGGGGGRRVGGEGERSIQGPAFINPFPSSHSCLPPQPAAGTAWRQSSDIAGVVVVVVRQHFRF